jgi:hypothetical protein
MGVRFIPSLSETTKPATGTCLFDLGVATLERRLTACGMSELG